MRHAPVEATRRLCGRRGRALLHSAASGDAGGRFSFVTSDPLRTIEARGAVVIERDASGGVVAQCKRNPLERLEEMLDASPASSEVDGPAPMAIGYLSYDLGRTLVGLPARDGRDAGAPDLWFGIYGACLRFDHERGEVALVGADLPARERLARILERPERSGDALRLGRLGSDAATELSYRCGFESIAEYILAGDVYQVNLARRLSAPVERDGDALPVYEALIAASAAEYSAFLEVDGARILSLSPERFLFRAAGSDRLETRPIKGTRRRSGEATVDAARARDLETDPKERAEHLMIVDLERNDLGRVAATGSVAVDSFARIVELPHLYHMISTVSARLRPEVGLADILRATFPGGSITGAPKRRAMEIIDEVEPNGRGLYTGAIGYLGQGGALDLSIAIRTATIERGELAVHVGGGIVADSTLERELEETEEKAAGFRAALDSYLGPPSHSLPSRGGKGEIRGRPSGG